MSDHQSLSFTQRGIRPINKLICLSLVSAALLMLDSRYAPVQTAKRYVATALVPLQWVATQPVEWYKYGSALFQSQNYLLSENQRLMQENSRLKLQVHHADLQAKELSDLKSLYSLSQHGLKITTAAEVVSNGREPIGSHLTINKGSKEGVRAGDAVVDDTGLIGQVSEVHPLTAEVSLLTDSNTVVPIMVARTGVRSLVYGGSGELLLRYFPTDADLQPNDILVTSGLDSIYPAGIPVAKVMQTSRNAGTPFYRVQLTALAAFRSSKYVLVLPQTEQPAVQAASAASAVAASAPTAP
ncbi:rod shape-determining protein MreC [Kingella negevensis]|uniref:rod shape-determining protein MreC n=1 Tax=Kingella negevensis TaxID=1522312 RepID=UPI002543C2C8|nr:rod shape-determining protein MreC [Kingella negevensis]WII92624.1 rod shape-determining protein MreC [Kingella negevensis]